MATLARVHLTDAIERRYLGLVHLARGLADAHDWHGLAAAISRGAEEARPEPPAEPPGVRVWAVTAGGFDEVARHPAGRRFARVPPRELQRAALLSEPFETSDGALLVGLHSSGVSLGVVEVDQDDADAELLGHAASLLACRVSLLAAQGADDVVLAPLPIDGSGEAASLMSTFAGEARRQLEHDRLSAYLLTRDGRAFERFAVATSPIVPGEGVIIPFEDVGLRHIVITNRALVSPDLGADPRIVGREDRVIASAGFHSLLSVPLRLHGRPIGVLNFVSRTPGFYGQHDIPIAQQIADQIAGFVGNLQVQQRMRTLIRHEAAEQERTRVARDVYHAVAQAVPAIERVGAELHDRLAGKDPQAGALAALVQELARDALGELRRAVVDLVPRGLDAHTLEEGIRSALATEGGDRPQPTLHVRGDTAQLLGAVRRGAFRIFQEALLNVRLHAGAGKVRVTLDCGRDLVLTVADDGCGFDPEEAGRAFGLGLRFMSDRARALGGTLAIDSAPGRGTTVRFELLGVRDAAGPGAPRTEGFDAAAQQAGRVRVFVAERHALMRAGLVRLTETSPHLRVVGDAATIDEARGQVRRLRPDVLLLDNHLGDGDLERLIAELRREQPALGILVLAEGSTGREAALADAGAAGFLEKAIDESDLEAAIRAVAEGSTIPPGTAAHPPDGRSTLSARERSILALMAAGHTNSEIGRTLFLATKTVERQVATIVRKLGARNRAHAAALAVARRMADPEGGPPAQADTPASP